MAKGKSNKPWSGRFSGKTDRLAEELNASISFDCRLFRHDIRGSMAHAMVLERAGVLTKTETRKITAALRAIEKEMASGKLKFTPADEDIHMAVEKKLIKKIGPAGGKLHTGRSRNDQVATATRLFMKDALEEVLDLAGTLQAALFHVARRNVETVMPGYTHLQRAQPVLLAHHLLAYYEMLKRDRGRLRDCLTRLDELPLGAGALAGSPYNLDRRYAARLLGFSAVTENSMDSVSDRDFIIEFLSAASILMMHLSRLSEELILWSSAEFGFVEISDGFATGSSIMPQKKNPDLAELARGKTGRVYGNLMTLLTVMKALPLAYNKDMQEDKEPLFDTVDTLRVVLGVFPRMIKTMKVNKRAMREATASGFLTATDAADYLVKKGLPFRESHAVVGKAVAHCIKNKKGLEELTLKEWKGFSTLFGRDIKRAVSVEASVGARKTTGGTAKKQVEKRLREVAKELGVKW
ncbi:MAG: argininosuccinate lyase [Thermodesulfobacteriota bacterium]